MSALKDYEINHGMVMVPVKEFKKIMEMIEDSYDKMMLDASLSLSSESIPGDVAKALVLGEDHPLRVWRKHRGLTQQALADSVGVSKTTISEIESGRKEGSVSLFKELAAALSLDVGDLLN